MSFQLTSASLSERLSGGDDDPSLRARIFSTIASTASTALSSAPWSARDRLETSISVVEFEKISKRSTDGSQQIGAHLCAIPVCPVGACTTPDSSSYTARAYLYRPVPFAYYRFDPTRAITQLVISFFCMFDNSY